VSAFFNKLLLDYFFIAASFGYFST